MKPSPYPLRAAVSALLCLVGPFLVASEGVGQEADTGDAIVEARAMVAAMGGAGLWGSIQTLHFVHEWDLASRVDRYEENEILDLLRPRSFVTMESEVYQRTRAYSPEHRYWNVVDGDFSFAPDEALGAALERAPFSIYRLAARVARRDPELEVRWGALPGRPQVQALEFLGADGEPHGWVVLNARSEPIIWATTQYEYAFGPLARYGNLWVPRWGTTGGGLVRYEMLSLTASTAPPPDSLFVPPATGGDR